MGFGLQEGETQEWGCNHFLALSTGLPGKLTPAKDCGVQPDCLSAPLSGSLSRPASGTSLEAWGLPAPSPSLGRGSKCLLADPRPHPPGTQWHAPSQGEGKVHPACPAPKHTHTSGHPPPRGEGAEPKPLGRHPARSLPPSLPPARE